MMQGENQQGSMISRYFLCSILTFTFVEKLFIFICGFQSSKAIFTIVDVLNGYCTGSN